MLLRDFTFVVFFTFFNPFQPFLNLVSTYFFRASVTNNHGLFDVSSWISQLFLYLCYFQIEFYFSLFLTNNELMYQSHEANSTSTCRSLSRPRTREKRGETKEKKGIQIWVFSCLFCSCFVVLLFFLPRFSQTQVLEFWDHVPSSTEK